MDECGYTVWRPRCKRIPVRFVNWFTSLNKLSVFVGRTYGRSLTNICYDASTTTTATAAVAATVDATAGDATRTRSLDRLSLTDQPCYLAQLVATITPTESRRRRDVVRPSTTWQTAMRCSAAPRRSRPIWRCTVSEMVQPPTYPRFDYRFTVMLFAVAGQKRVLIW